MKSITLHNLDSETTKKIEKIAKEKNLSLNKVIKQLLQKALGINSSKKELRKEEFKEFLGVWDEEEFNRFNKATESLNEINPDDWK